MDDFGDVSGLSSPEFMLSDDEYHPHTLPRSTAKGARRTTKNGECSYVYTNIYII